VERKLASLSMDERCGEAIPHSEAGTTRVTHSELVELARSSRSGTQTRYELAPGDERSRMRVPNA
jgi:hypothetical protein